MVQSFWLLFTSRNQYAPIKRPMMKIIMKKLPTYKTDAKIIHWKRCLQICCLLCYILSVGWERLIHGFVLLFIIGSKSLTIKILFRYLKYCCHSGPAHKWIVECWPLSSCFPPPILNLCLIWNAVLCKMYTWWHLGWLFLGTADRGNPMVRTTNS